MLLLCSVHCQTHTHTHTNTHSHTHTHAHTHKSRGKQNHSIHCLRSIPKKKRLLACQRSRVGHLEKPASLKCVSENQSKASKRPIDKRLLSPPHPHSIIHPPPPRPLAYPLSPRSYSRAVQACQMGNVSTDSLRRPPVFASWLNSVPGDVPVAHGCVDFLLHK